MSGDRREIPPSTGAGKKDVAPTAADEVKPKPEPSLLPQPSPAPPPRHSANPPPRRPSATPPPPRPSPAPVPPKPSLAPVPRPSTAPPPTPSTAPPPRTSTTPSPTPPPPKPSPTPPPRSSITSSPTPPPPQPSPTPLPRLSITPSPTPPPPQPSPTPPPRPSITPSPTPPQPSPTPPPRPSITPSTPPPPQPSPTPPPRPSITPSPTPPQPSPTPPPRPSITPSTPPPPQPSPTPPPRPSITPLPTPPPSQPSITPSPTPPPPQPSRTPPPRPSITPSPTPPPQPSLTPQPRPSITPSPTPPPPQAITPSPTTPPPPAITPSPTPPPAITASPTPPLPASPSQQPPPPAVIIPSQRLRLNPSKDHQSEKYEDLQLDFGPEIFGSLEKYLPPSMLSKSRDDKVNFMREILLKYLPHGERTRVQKLRDYRQLLISNYQPLQRGVYSMQPALFFVPSFIKAISDNTVESFRRVMSEPSPGVFTFEIFTPRFCDLLLAEIENFENWVDERQIRVLRPNTMNKFGAVLDDFGFEGMLDKLVDVYIRPLAKVFYPEVGGASLDSHHGFVVEYGEGRDTDLGFHVDDSEVTLNVCLGKQFSGGDLYFRGTRCDKHVNTSKLSEEIFDYAHVPGRAVLHRGRHRHGVRATTSGHRINLLLWCKSSVYREMKKYQKDFPLWCEQCLRDKKEKEQSSLATTRSEVLGNECDSVGAGHELGKA